MKQTYIESYYLAASLRALDFIDARFNPNNNPQKFMSLYDGSIPMHSGLNQGGRGTSACFRMEMVENHCLGLIFGLT